MGAAKKKQPSSAAAAPLRRLISWLFGRGRPALIVIVLAAIFGGGIYVAWVMLKPQILRSSEYRLSPEQVEVTPPPPWIERIDIRSEVLQNPTLDGSLSLMDDDLVERIGNAFARHPWVAKVVHVAKQYGAVKVELVYRKPVCAVKTPGGPLLVDAEATLLRTDDVTPLQAAHYPCLLGVDRQPTVLPGSRWTDPRVIGAAEIADAFGDAWEPMRLRDIEPLTVDPARSGEAESSRLSAEPFFVLVTQSGTRILWGYAPGVNALRELPATEKVDRIKRCFAVHDTLDGPQGRQDLDVRTMPSVRP